MILTLYSVCRGDPVYDIDMSTKVALLEFVVRSISWIIFQRSARYDFGTITTPIAVVVNVLPRVCHLGVTVFRTMGGIVSPFHVCNVA